MTDNACRVRADSRQDDFYRSASPVRPRPDLQQLKQKGKQDSETNTLRTSHEESAAIESKEVEEAMEAVESTRNIDKDARKQEYENASESSQDESLIQRISVLEQEFRDELSQRQFIDLTERKARHTFRSNLRAVIAFELFEDDQYIGDLVYNPDISAKGRVNHDHFQIGGEIYEMNWRPGARDDRPDPGEEEGGC